jgi:hypothetical protein
MPEESTTPDLVELTRLAWEAVGNRGDMQALGANYSPNAVLDTAGYGMGTFEGREAAVGFLKEWVSSFEDLTIEVDEILDLGNDVVLTLYHQKGRPIGGTKYVRVRSAGVSMWVDDMVVRTTLYSDIDEARAAAERLAQERR